MLNVIILSMKTSPKAIYYESKIQYFIITIVFILFFSYITFANPDNLGVAGQYFLGISIFAFVFVCFYQVSKFYIYDDRLIWKKGWNKVECPWSDIVAIHYDIQKNYSSKGNLFKQSSAFYIETKKGFTKYADKNNIKLKGGYTFSSKGKELVAQIKSASKCKEKTSAVSVFKQRQKLWDWVLLILAIFIVPIIIILLYSVFTKDYSFFKFFITELIGMN